MSPVNETRDYDYWHQNKGTDQVWCFMDDVHVHVCQTEGQKPLESTLCSTCEKLILTCMTHTPTMSPVNETQDYDYWHQSKGTDQVWCFMDVVCGIEGQKPVKISVYM